MIIRSVMLALGLVIVPVTLFGQSYEWFDRWNNKPRNQDTDDPRTAVTRDIDASEFGIYSTGEIECIPFDTCYGFIAGFRAEDGKRLWRQKISLSEHTYGSALAVNEHGVFVAGSADYINQAGRWAEGGFVQAYSHDGSVLWTLRDVRVDRVSRDIVFDDHGLYVVGSTRPSSWNAVVRHISFEGEVLWTVQLGIDTGVGSGILIEAGTLYVSTDAHSMDVVRTDGTYVGRIPVDGGRANTVVLRDSAIYNILDGQYVQKVGLDGVGGWRLPFHSISSNFTSPSALADSEDGLVVATGTTRRYPNGTVAQTGQAFVKLDFDGNILAVEELPGHELYVSTLSIRDGTYYSGGGDAPVYCYALSEPPHAAYTARYTPKDLLLPSLLTLANTSPSLPPRLAVLDHDYGAGPVRAAIREASAGSPEQVVEFSMDLKPVGYEKVPDVNGNGYEELAVLSRLPAAIEVRDSLDGSLLTYIRLGRRFEPIAAAVDAIGAVPRVAVVERNMNTGSLLLRVYGLPDGVLLGTVALNRNFDPVDIVAVQSLGGSRFAILVQDPVAGSPHKIEIVGIDGAPATRYWMSPENLPIAIELVAGASGPALAVLRNDISVQRPTVRVIDLQGGYDLTKPRFVEQFAPVAMATRPNGGTGGHPQIIALSETFDNRAKAEARDAGSGSHDYGVSLNRKFHPLDVSYVDARLATGAELFGLLVRRDPDDFCYPSEIRAVLIDAETGGPQFELQFLVPE